MKNTNTFLLITIILFTISCSTKSKNNNQDISVPLGWYQSKNNSFVTIVKKNIQRPGYTIKINRPVQNKEDAYYINVAESIYPNQKKLYAYSKTGKKNKLKNWYFERLWWIEEFHERRIPYSLTGDAINYYLDLATNFIKVNKKKIQKNRWKGDNEDRLEFNYSVKVIRESSEQDSKDNPKRQIRVIMKFKWFEFCGQPCGWGFEKSREVTFNGRHQIVSITGDGPTKKWTSTSRTPWAPQQWIAY